MKAITRTTPARIACTADHSLSLVALGLLAHRHQGTQPLLGFCAVIIFGRIPLHCRLELVESLATVLLIRERLQVRTQRPAATACLLFEDVAKRRSHFDRRAGHTKNMTVEDTELNARRLPNCDERQAAAGAQEAAARLKPDLIDITGETTARWAARIAHDWGR